MFENRQTDSNGRDEFLATLAHEMRNPLSAISHAVQVLQRLRDQPDRTVELHEMIGRQVNQMLRLIEDLLDISRVRHGKMKLKIRAVDLRDVIALALDSARPTVEAAGHRLIIDQTDEPLEVMADSARLVQVVTNLLTNAAKYTPSGGEIRLVTQRLKNDAVVRVWDNGIGIPANRLSHIFDMFCQVDSESEVPQGGLGIGLALVKRLVEIHGGAVTAHSDGRGTGSEFVVRLPLRVKTPLRASILSKKLFGYDPYPLRQTVNT